MLRPTLKARERIMLMGNAGTGKSRSILSIAKKAQQTKSPAHFYIIDTDAAVERMLESGFPDLNNVTYEPCFEWSDYTSTLDQFLNKAGPDDFLAVDLISPAWPAVEEWFIDQVFGKDSADFYMEARKSMKKGGALDGFRDWGQINREWRRWVNKLVFRSKSHVIVTAGVAPINMEMDSKQIKEWFAPFGLKPKGQKDLAHHWHTILLLGAKTPGEHTISTIKDREREVLVAEKFNDFCLDYLVKRAGWKL